MIEYSVWVASTDVSSSVIIAVVNRTLHRIGENPTVGRATIALDDPDGDYSPERRAAFLPNVPVHLYATDTDTGSVYDLFTGWASGFKTNPMLANRGMSIDAEDNAKFYSRKINTEMRVQTDVKSLFADVYAAMSLTTVFSLDNDITASIPYALYDNNNGVNALGDLLASGAHRSFVATDGTIRVKERNKWLTGTSVGTIDNSYSAFDYSLTAGRVKNNIQLSVAPRKATTSVVTLSYLETVPIIAANDQISFFMSFKDFDQGEDNIPANSVTTLAANTDWTLNTASDGSGSNVTAQGSVTASVFTRSAKITVRNTSGSDAYLNKMQIRGYGLIRQPVFTAITEVNSSQQAYGDLVYSMRNDLISNQVFANEYSQLLSELWKDPQEEISFSPEVGLNPLTFEAELGDRISLEEEHTGVDAAYLITGVDHTIQIQSGLKHEVNFSLEVIGLGGFFILDDVNFGVLDVNKLAL